MVSSDKIGVVPRLVRNCASDARECPTRRGPAVMLKWMNRLWRLLQTVSPQGLASCRAKPRADGVVGGDGLEPPTLSV